MGIKNLSQFIRTKFESCVEKIHISEYAYKKISVDTSLFMCIFKASYQDRWLTAFIKLVECMRQNHVHCVFIYDTAAPPEKALEREERSSSRDKLTARIDDIERAVEIYEKGVASNEANKDILLAFQEKRGIQPPLLRILPNSKEFGDISLGSIKSEIQKMKAQNFTISKEDFDKTKVLFDILKVPYFQAPLEAETMCADLCKQDLVQGVLSRDTDVLAYGSPVFLTNLTLRDGMCERIKIKKLLKLMDLTYPQFLDFCIMSGTDYNRNIEKIGSVKAYSLIKEWGSIDNLPKNIDTSILRHVRSRELFQDYEQVSIPSVPHCGVPDFEELEKLLVTEHLYVDNDVKESFPYSKIVVEK